MSARDQEQPSGNKKYFNSQITVTKKTPKFLQNLFTKSISQHPKLEAKFEWNARGGTDDSESIASDEINAEDLGDYAPAVVVFDDVSTQKKDTEFSPDSENASSSPSDSRINESSKGSESVSDKFRKKPPPFSSSSIAASSSARTEEDEKNAKHIFVSKKKTEPQQLEEMSKKKSAKDSSTKRKTEGSSLDSYRSKSDDREQSENENSMTKKKKKNERASANLLSFADDEFI